MEAAILDFSILVCPCCKVGRIKPVANEMLCTNSECSHHKVSAGFGLVGSRPIFICNIHCDTAFDPSKIQSYIERGSPNDWKKKLSSFFLPQSKLTELNSIEFIKKTKSLSKSPRILIIGGGEVGSGMHELILDKDLKISSIDVYCSSNVDALVDCHYLPFSNGSFDGIWIQAVLEHVFEPNVVVGEIHRVLKLGGLVYAETPFLTPVHEGAYDITRFTPMGHRFLFRSFEEISFGGNKGVEIVLAQSIRYFFWGLFRSRFPAQIAFALSLIILKPFKILISKKLDYDATAGVFFFGKKTNVRLRHSDLPPLYQGFMK